MKSTVIAWARYDRRPDLLAQHLGTTAHYVFYGQRDKLLQAPLRYSVQAKRMWRILMQERPDVVFVQNPPIFCPLIAALYAQRYGARYVIDSHTGAFLSPKWRWAASLHRRLSRRAAATLVSNKQLQAVVQGWGSEALVLGYTPGKYPQGEKFAFNGRFNAVVISSFNDDEPLDVVFAAAARLPAVNFYVTGDDRRLQPQLRAQKPNNCHLTGYISYDRYIGLLRGADVMVDLTTNDHTLLMGAYEAVSLGTPMILSDWPVLRECFSKGAIHIPNTVEGLHAGVLQAQRQQGQLRQDLLVLQQELNDDWDRQFGACLRLINATSSGARGV